MISRIFIVDDEQIIASTLAQILKLQGFDTRFFTDPVEALDFARCNAPDLLISDVMMPKMTGIELAIGLRACCPACKVLLFSGQAHTSDLLHEACSEGHDFRLLTKPLHPDELIANIDAIAN